MCSGGARGNGGMRSLIFLALEMTIKGIRVFSRAILMGFHSGNRRVGK